MKDTINTKMVREAYKATKTKPARGHYYGFKGAKLRTCCGIGVLAYNETGETDSEIAWRWASRKFGTMYTAGFISGFDGKPTTEYYTKHTKNENWRAGRRAGQRAARALGL